MPGSGFKVGQLLLHLVYILKMLRFIISVNAIIFFKEYIKVEVKPAYRILISIPSNGPTNTIEPLQSK